MSRKCDIGVVRLMSLGILTSFPGGAIGRAGRKAGDLITIRMDPADIPIGTPPPPTPSLELFEAVPQMLKINNLSQIAHQCRHLFAAYEGG